MAILNLLEGRLVITELAVVFMLVKIVVMTCSCEMLFPMGKALTLNFAGRTKPFLQIGLPFLLLFLTLFAEKFLFGFPLHTLFLLVFATHRMILLGISSTELQITKFARKLRKNLGFNGIGFQQFPFKGFIGFVLNPLNLGFLLKNLEFGLSFRSETIGFEFLELFLSFFGFGTLRTGMVAIGNLRLVMVDEDMLLNPCRIALLVGFPSRKLILMLQKSKLLFIIGFGQGQKTRPPFGPTFLLRIPFRKRFTTQLLIMGSILPTLVAECRSLLDFLPIPSPTLILSNLQIHKTMLSRILRFHKIPPCLLTPSQLRIRSLKSLKKTILLRLLRRTNLLILVHHLRDLFPNLVFRVLRQENREATNVLQA